MAFGREAHGDLVAALADITDAGYASGEPEHVARGLPHVLQQFAATHRKRHGQRRDALAGFVKKLFVDGVARHHVGLEILPQLQEMLIHCAPVFIFVFDYIWSGQIYFILKTSGAGFRSTI
ncbi:hypothetical protein [Massilia eburnea]|uniref:hypothetical protein n=1 Tax=Massilia eburnea TaxID=1776165 RepID=UPI003D6A4C2A